MLVLLSLVTGIVIQRHILHVKRIEILEKDEIPENIARIYGVFTTDYVNNLIDQYKRHPTSKEEEGVLTRSKQKQKDKEEREIVEAQSTSDSDGEEAVHFDV